MNYPTPQWYYQNQHRWWVKDGGLYFGLAVGLTILAIIIAGTLYLKFA